MRETATALVNPSIDSSSNTLISVEESEYAAQSPTDAMTTATIRSAATLRSSWLGPYAMRPTAIRADAKSTTAAMPMMTCATKVIPRPPIRRVGWLWAAA